MDLNLKKLQVWFVTGSQHLYGDETLQQVAANSKHIVAALNDGGEIPVEVVHKPILTSSDSISRLMAEANAAKECIGIISWMHTFSPARMWIAGLNTLRKPLHFHTQFVRDIPWAEIDMDFMILTNQPRPNSALSIPGWAKIENRCGPLAGPAALRNRHMVP